METRHTVYLVIGSNIDPAANIRRALEMLRAHGQVGRISTTWETYAIGSSGPNYLNTAALFYTDLTPESLKFDLLRPIENRLGRVRTEDKNAPRPIDLDIAVYDGVVVDKYLWMRPFMVLTLAELLPGLRHPESGQTLFRMAREMLETNWAIPHPELTI